MSQFYTMKWLLEELFGHAVYMRLKETGTIQDWRKETRRLLDALHLASNSTVEVVDAHWRKELAELVQRGKSDIARARHIDDLFCYLSTALARIAFLQLGSIPSRYFLRKETTPLTPRYWTLTAFRSVQYVQNEAQRARLEDLLAKRAENLKRIAEREGQEP
jgi:hypothetical protein